MSGFPFQAMRFFLKVPENLTTRSFERTETLDKNKGLHHIPTGGNAATKGMIFLYKLATKNLTLLLKTHASFTKPQIGKTPL